MKKKTLTVPLFLEAMKFKKNAVLCPLNFMVGVKWIPEREIQTSNAVLSRYVFDFENPLRLRIMNTKIFYFLHLFKDNILDQLLTNNHDFSS